METGYDAYKALALGADAVSVGRGILAPLLKEGKDGVVNKVKKMNEELSELMLYTGINDTKSFDSSVLYMDKKYTKIHILRYSSIIINRLCYTLSKIKKWR